MPGKKIIKREHYRNNGKGTKEIRAELLVRFPLESWRGLIQANFKKFSRYLRDQCLEAQRYFEADTDIECLDRACRFCLEHKTYSMANLRDTYRYYQELCRTGEKDILKTLEPQLKAVARYKKDIRVSKRSIGVYKSLVGIILGVWS
jgi:hypothetical protein